ncbi:MAG: 2-oxoacid:acceptor oxidoreductase family protein [Spirochaetes bacterium]|nr:2-oxoacid:acceptor oxidoreductase family protein [Spirochaetota bacterium]
MTNKIILAGFGGQGIILSGLLLAQAALLEGNEVTHYPAYGAEMRGGTCNCSVVISDKEISSPIVNKPDILLLFNQPSKNKFEAKCIPGAKVLINNSLINEQALRNDISSFYIDATNTANKLGNIKIANMIMLGALSKITGIVKLDSLINAMPEILSARNKKLIDLNVQALKEGYGLF